MSRNKLDKYGQRFIGEIAEFLGSNPGILISEETGELV